MLTRKLRERRACRKKIAQDNKLCSFVCKWTTRQREYFQSCQKKIERNRVGWSCYEVLVILVSTTEKKQQLEMK